MRKINPDWADPEIEKDEEYYYVPAALILFSVIVFCITVFGVVVFIIINWR